MSRNKAIWLARLLFHRGRLTREEISEAWSRSDEHAQRMAPSTFYDNRHLLEERFGIKLRCESGYYSLDIHDMREQEFMRQLFRYADDDIDTAPAIRFDEPPPAGYRYVATIAAAVEHRRLLHMTYMPFDKEGYSSDLAPYCLRTFRGRCYVVGFSSRHGEIRTFALDRINALAATEHAFRPDASFSAKRYFAHSFGAYGGMSLQAEHIVIEADTRAAAYLRSRPLHPTQRETSPASASMRHDERTEHAFTYRFELNIAVSADFVRELLFYGAELRVIAPEHLRRTIKEIAQNMSALY